MTIVLNIPVAILCYKLLGRQFFFRSVRCMILSSLFVDYVAPLQQWALWTDGSDPAGRVISVDGTRELEQFSEYDIETQATIYGFLEKIYLSSFAAVPLYYRNSASLVSQKGDFAVSTYIDRIAFGGLRFYTYAYTDEEWKEAAGKLEYTVSTD